MTFEKPFGLTFILLAFVLVFSGSSQADAAAYIKFDGVDGESTDANHDKWIDVLSIDWGARSGGPPRSGSGDVSVTKYVDKASPKLQQSCATGGRYKEVVLSSPNKASPSTPYLRYKLRDVIPSSQSCLDDPS